MMVRKAVIVGLLLVVALSSMGFGRKIVVTSTADSGTGSFRWALQTARSGDTITFDPTVFPPEDPATIYPRSELPQIHCGNLTIDTSNTGAILDGSRITQKGVVGLRITSDGNTVRGLQIVGFPEGGVLLCCGARDNTIGGDRSIGIGPIGQGNLCGGNSGGIFLRGDGTSYNTITGNLIGTDVTGMEPLGNIDGVVIENGASNNIIGPDNVIAHNRESGVLIAGSGIAGNTITQNSIHNNGWVAVRFQSSSTFGVVIRPDGGDEGLPPFPIITGLDHTCGKAMGLAPPGCIIEIFSDDGSQGEVYEGHSTADQEGIFIFEKGSRFARPHLTATVTNTDGSTSEFSPAATWFSGSLGLQSGKEQPMHRLAREQGSYLEYNRIGIMYALLDSAGLEDVELLVDIMDSLGLMWDKFYIDVPDGNEVGVLEGYSDGNITLAQDGLVDRFVERGWKIVMGLVFWDESANARVAEQGVGYSRYETEEEVQAYLDHIQSIVRHFKGRIEYYEILNEPNVAKGTQQYVAVDHYINLVNRAVPIIRREDPQAKIVVGAVASAFSGVGNDGIEYLFSILRSDVMPLVDAISWHPFNGESPNDPTFRDYYYAYPDLVQRIKSAASSHGFTGEYMGSELFWKTPLSLSICPGCGGPVSSTIQAAKYYAREITLGLGMDIVTGVGGLHTVRPIHAVVRNLCIAMAGHEAIDMPVEITIDFEPTAYCAFRYPNGDRVLAIWTDGIAQDEDPGVPATITIPGLTAETVTGIDVLHGFEQELVFEVDGADTIIRDLLVKDYPILIRLNDVKMSSGHVENVGDGFHRLGDVNAVQSRSAGGSDRDGDGVPDDKDYCPDWPGSKEANGC